MAKESVSDDIHALNEAINEHIASGKRVKIYLGKDFDQAFDAISADHVSIFSKNFLDVESGNLSHLVNIKYITNIAMFDD